MEGDFMSKKKKNRARSADDFTDVIFSWSLEDIFNENLYKDQVQSIPECFDSVEDYLGSFIYPLIEDTRAELCSSMEMIDRAPFAEVMSFNGPKCHGTFTYHVEVSTWKNRLIDRGRELYKLLPGDVLLISDSKPESVSDLGRMSCTWDFASVSGRPDDSELEDGSSVMTFKIKSPRDLADKFGENRSLYVVFLLNMTTNKRIWNSLHMLTNVNIIQQVLQIDTLGSDYCSFCAVHENMQMDERDKLFLEFKLNDSQTEAVMTSVFRAKCDQTSHVELIWGPPGTGKTRTISVILFSLLRMNCRILSCAPTNVAVKEVASRVVKLVRNSFEAHSKYAAIICPLGEILLFGNKDRLKIGSDIEEIYLEYRVKMLEECLGPDHGWRACIAPMISFMEDCHSQYNVFVENEMSKMKEEKDEVPMEKLKSFLQFCRDKFIVLLPPLRRCMILLCTHVPRSFICEQNFQAMLHLIFLLESLELLLFEETLTSVELEDLFSRMEPANMEDSLDTVDGTSSLRNMRNQFLHALKTLENSLATLSFPIVLAGNPQVPLIEFCYRNASLIFCTAASSYKLHHVDIEPLDLLVVDEAAQSKECETIIPLQLHGLRHAILVGDECQLPAIVHSKVSDYSGFGRSLFERLTSQGYPKKLLDIQYRMHPAISQFPNSKFYCGMILDAEIVRSEEYEISYLPERMYGPYSFINVSGGREIRDDNDYSLRNMVEVAVAMKILQKLYKAWNGSGRSLSIGLLSPYAAQVSALQEKVHPKYENIDRFSVKVKSIDGFQGGEEDIIIFSAVRANNGGSIGFLSSPLRTNVALTRARHSLWILGNEKTLSNNFSIWRTLILDAKDRQCFFDAHEDSELSKTIVKVKKELDELDDLVRGDCTLFDKGKWQVIFSENFRQSFGKLKSVHKKQVVIDLLLKLASGWRPKRKSVESVCERSSQVVMKFKVEQLYVICTIDIVKDLYYKQIFKVWDVSSLDEIPKLLRRLDSIFCMYTEDYINRCKEKYLDRDLVVPKCWPASLSITRYKVNNNSSGSDSGDAENGRSYVENARVNESLLLMKFYSLSSGIVNYLLSYQDFGELDLPFEVTDEEREVIQFPKSSFILGRSGTGKTTVLTMKLFQREQMLRLATEGFAAGVRSKAPAVVKSEFNYFGDEAKEAVLRQLFVTVSSKLCYAVKQHVLRLKSFSCGGKTLSSLGSFDVDDMDDIDHFKGLPDSFVNIPAEKYPLVITFQKFLMMLDGTLGDSYFNRFHEIRVSSENDVRFKSVALRKFIRTKEVTFDRFSLCYWPHLNGHMTKNLDPSKVFTEIISHIKGGLQAGDASDGKLSREVYVSMSDARSSTLSAEERERIFNIYEDYEKMKVKCGEFDLADFVTNLHVRLKTEGLKCEKMDFVYIDEVQDLTMRQICLFKYICGNVDEGFVFSGDTAQTIARGKDFRFEDIRYLFYREFLTQPKDDSRSKKEKGRVSEMFNLYQNFRTHAGVLRLAQSVIDLLCHFFPESLDVLRPETSLIYGESPVLLEAGSDENAVVTIFGNAENAGGKIVGFGAEQVILVRDDSARKEVSSYVGNHALVLTIVECKGLEFQDVLLYNFFSASPLKNQWRVIYNYIKERDLLDPSSAECFPTFSHGRHCIMCSELKQLYVAITRTRQRLWICENKDELSEPMFDYWKRLRLVQVKKVDDSLAQAMQMASSPAEWKSRGIKLYWERNYEMATMCFERAGDANWEKKAKASALRATADYLRASNAKEACSVLQEAAEIFDSIGQAESAAECFCDLGEYERAGKLYLEKCGESELRKAGECFALAKCYEQAAEAYDKGNYYSDCLSVCKVGKLFNLGLQYIETWKRCSHQNGATTGRSADMDKVEQEFLESCALSYYEAHDKILMMKFVRAFCSMDARRSFLKSMDCIDELLLLEKESGNFKEAAEVANLKGDVLLEANLLGQGGYFREASSLILSYVMSKSLWADGSRGWLPKHFPHKQELEKAKSFAKEDSEKLYELVCKQALVLSSENTDLPGLHQCLYYAWNHEKLGIEMMSTMNILDAHLHTGTTKYVWPSELPDDVKKYSLDLISQNHVSFRTLVYFWGLWSESMLNVIKYLESSECFMKHTSVREFCLNYFGVRRLVNNSDVTYVLLNPDAQWVKKVDSRFTQKRRNVMSIDAHQFSLAAGSHCQSETVSVGLRVLQTLESLHNLSKNKCVSAFCQGTCLTDIYQVTLSILSSFDCNNDAKRWLQSFCWKHVFPFDFRDTLVESFVSLRKTDASQKFLEGVIVHSISGRTLVTYGQIGRIVMVLLGLGKSTPLLCNYIAEQLDKKFFSWKNFLHTLSLEKSASITLAESEVKVPLVENFHMALMDTYNTNWQVNDYMSPHCFLYLVERLVILVSQSRVVYYTTKYSFVEWIMYLQSDVHPIANSTVVVQPNVDIIFDSLSTMVQQFLYRKQDTIKWIKRSNIKHDNYYSLMVLRLVVILCLLYLNSGKYFEVLFDIVRRKDMLQLPRHFADALRFGVKRNHAYANIDMIAEGFNRIGIPLVIVSVGQNSRKIACRDAICVDANMAANKDDILGMLFPKDRSNDYQEPSPQASKPSVDGRLPAADDEHHGNDDTNQNINPLARGESKHQFRWSFFEEMFSVVKTEQNSKVESPSKQYTDLFHKVELGDHINFLASVLSRDKLRFGENGLFYQEVSNMLQELEQLSTLLDLSEADLKANLERIGELLNNVLLRRSTLEAILNQLAVPDDEDAKTSVHAPCAVENVQEEAQDNGKGKTAPDPSGSNENDKANEGNKGKEKGKGEQPPVGSSVDMRVANSPQGKKKKSKSKSKGKRGKR